MTDNSTRSDMRTLLQEPRFDFLSLENKRFIELYDDEMSRLGYNFGGQIGSGYCWGRFMTIYRKTGVKSDKVYTRIYMRANGEVVVRMFLVNVDLHRVYIENAPENIKHVFTGSHGDCNHCPDKASPCQFCKIYTVNGRLIEKCSGVVFEIHQPQTWKITDFSSILTEFYPRKRAITAARGN